MGLTGEGGATPPPEPHVIFYRFNKDMPIGPNMPGEDAYEVFLTADAVTRGLIDRGVLQNDHVGSDFDSVSGMYLTLFERLLGQETGDNDDLVELQEQEAGSFAELFRNGPGLGLSGVELLNTFARTYFDVLGPQSGLDQQQRQDLPVTIWAFGRLVSNHIKDVNLPQGMAIIEAASSLYAQLAARLTGQNDQSVEQMLASGQNASGRAAEFLALQGY